MPRELIIAIDGPSGVGKGTIARRVANALGYRHLDTGAMYRAVGWAALERHVELDAEDEVAAIARAARFEVTDALVSIDGRNVTQAIRTPRIDKAASVVSRLPRVRAVLVDRQRALGANGGVVMEGRDIGTIVFPDADVKIYLDASAEERARRRAADPAHAGSKALPLSTLAAEMLARDRSDQTREASPLRPAEDAHVIDTTRLSVDQVVERVLEIVRTRTEGPKVR